MATVSDLNKGSYIRYNGEVVQVEELQHRTPGNLRAFYQVKMRNVRNGKIVENRFRPGDAVVNVTYTEPGMQGDTATRTLKAATIETGAEIRVPLFVNTGDNIKIKTATGEYVERV